MFYFILLPILMFISGCSNKQFSTDASFDNVKRTTKHNLMPYGELQEFSYAYLRTIENNKITELSLKEAISLALKNNPGLQAKFQELGIGQADLVQAGLFTNPDVTALFRLPYRKQDDMNIELDAPLFNIIDLWRVPLAKKVAEAELEVITQDILEEILTVYAETKKAYYTAVFAQETYNLVLETVKQTQEMLDWVNYRYEFGFETELDLKMTHIKLKNWQSMSFVYHAKLHNAFTHLTTLLGMKISPEPFKLTDSLEHQEQDIPNMTALEEQALDTRPEIHMQRMKVRRAYHNLSLQRTLVFNDIRVGISYKLDFEQQQGVGPGLNMQIPVFDWNQAQTQKAKVDAEMQSKMYLQTQRNVISEVQMHYRSYIAGLEEIALHDEALKIYQEAIEFTKTYADKMMFSRSTIFQTTINYLEERIAYMEKHLEAHRNFTMLEKAIGKQIS